LNQELTPDICQIIYDFVIEIKKKNIQAESQDS
jgi:hypothetical protein